MRHILHARIERSIKSTFKVPMKWKIISAYLKALSKIQKNGVLLFEISFFVLEISTFFYYANLIRDDVILFASKMWKILNKRYLWKYWNSVLETSHHKCTSQKKQNDTLSAVSIATLLAQVSFCQKAKKSPFATSTVGQRVLLGTEIVPILS